jgi:hypothetical protein
MIATKDKIKIFKEILPFGFMYENDAQRSILSFERGYSYYLPFDLKQDFETEEDFIIAVKVLHRKNVMSFLLKAMGFNKNEFLNFLEEQFYLCKNKNEDCVSFWLESIYHFLLKEDNVFIFQEGLNEKRGAFLKWYNDIKKTIPAETIQEEKILSISQIALKYAYENIELITRDNADGIAKKYNHSSGGKLYQKFSFYYDRNNRKAKPHPSYTIKTLNNKIKLFESVIELLTEEIKGKAIDELRILKGFLVEFE